MQHNNKQNAQVDVVILIGPENKEDLQQHIGAMISLCNANQLTYAIYGDGKKRIPQTEIESMPQSTSVIMIGHGNIYEDTSQQKYHHIDLIENPDNSSNQISTIDLLKQVQDQTGCSQFMIGSCYSGFVNHALAQQSQLLKQGTEILVTSSASEPTAKFHSFTASVMLLKHIAQSKIDSNSQLSHLYPNLIASIPETLGYGQQQDQGFSSFSVRREDRLLLSDASAYQWISFNHDKYQTFCQEKNVATSPPNLTTMKDLHLYRIRSLENHILHGDNEIIAKVIQHDQSILKDYEDAYQSSVLANVLKNIGNHQRSIKSDEKLFAMLKVLIEYDRDGIDTFMEKKFKDLSQEDKQQVLLLLSRMINQHPEMALSNKGFNPLLYVIETNRLHLLNVLLNNHADPKLVTSRGISAYDYALSRTVFASDFADHDVVNILFDHALAHDNFDFIAKCIDKGMKPDLHQSRRLLDSAPQLLTQDSFLLLATNGADIFNPLSGDNGCIYDHIKNEEPQLAEKLTFNKLQSKLENLFDAEEEFLGYETMCEEIEDIIHNKTQFNINSQDSNGDTLLHHIIASKNQWAISILIDNYHANLDVANSQGITPRKLITEMLINQADEKPDLIAKLNEILQAHPQAPSEQSSLSSTATMQRLFASNPGAPTAAANHQNKTTDEAMVVSEAKKSPANTPATTPIIQSETTPSVSENVTTQTSESSMRFKK